MQTNRKILIITYYWPPSGGAGVQRWLKFAKYLPEFGWEPVILTVDPKYAEYPGTDSTLEKDIRPETRVFRTKAINFYRFFKRNKNTSVSGGFASGKGKGLLPALTRFIRGNLFIPDPRKGWNKFAFREAIRLLIDEKIRYVITTGPPHSTHLIGLKIKEKLPVVKWITDFRDPWTDIYYYNSFNPTRIARKTDRNFEEKTLNSSDHIISVSKKLLKLFESRVPGIFLKSTTIYNGFDESDFLQQEELPGKENTITYVGTMSEYYPVDTFLESISNIIETGIDIKFRIVGLISGSILDNANKKLGSDRVIYTKYSNHDQAISAMKESSILLLIIPAHPLNELIITGKIFEYLASGRPVMAIGPLNSELVSILAEFSHCMLFEYSDLKGMTGFIKNNLNHKECYMQPEKFSRLNLAKSLTELLEKI